MSTRVYLSLKEAIEDFRDYVVRIGDVEFAEEIDDFLFQSRASEVALSIDRSKFH